MRRLLHYLKPYYKRMGMGFLIKLIGTIMDLLLPWILAFMIDTVIPKRNEYGIYLWGGAMLLCSFLAVFCNIIANRMASKVAKDTTEVLRKDLFRKVIYLSERKMDSYTKPSLIARLTSDSYNVHQMIGRVQRLGVRAPILLLGGVLVTMTLNPLLSCILLVMVPFLSWIMVVISKRCIPMYQQLQKSLDQFVRIVREDISGIRVIKALSKEEKEELRFERINTQVVQREKKADSTMAIVDPSVKVIMNLALVCVIVVGAIQVNQGTTEVGKILAFTTYFTIILHATMMVSRMFLIVSKGIASANRIEEILGADGEESITIAKGIKPKEVPEEAKGAMIAFDHVSFSYLPTKGDEKTDNTVTDLTFSVKKGQTLGILGGTGAGKSTIINLLLHFYEADTGTIWIDGEEIGRIPLPKLRQRFGVVFQNDLIFEDSILENIRFGRDLSEEEILEALTSSCAKEFVEEREASEILYVKGANMSGGQKQRILIARALAGRPQILVLDDSSSALDYRTDARLRKGLMERYPDVTKVIIAQRISSVMHADLILVLEDGKIIGKGTHEELIKSCNIYQEISASQMGGESIA